MPEARSLSLSHHLRSPQVVQVNDSFELAVGVDYCQRSDFAFLHHGESGGCELGGWNCFRIARHALACGEVERVLAAVLEQAAEVTIANDAKQLLTINYSCNAQLLARHFVNH